MTVGKGPGLSTSYGRTLTFRASHSGVKTTWRRLLEARASGLRHQREYAL